MKNTRPLILLTINYPYGTGENFLNGELPFLKSQFSSITLIPLRGEGKINALPNDIEVIDTVGKKLTKQSFFAKSKKLLQALTHTPLYQELVHRPELFLYPHALKELLGYSCYVKELHQFLKNLLEKRTSFQRALFYSYWLHAPATALASLKKDYPTIQAISRAHRYDLYEEKHQPAFIPYRKSTLQYLDKIVPIAQDGYDYLRNKYHIPKQQLFLSRLGVSAAKKLAPPSQEGSLALISCSRLVPHKRVAILIEAIALLARKHQQLTIHWNHIGSGDQYLQLFDKAKALFPENVLWKFHGTLTNKEVFAFYQNRPTDLFLSASSTEGLPVSVMEATACGIPIIAGDVGGTKEIVRPENGILLSSLPTKEEFYNAIDSLLKEKGKLSSMRKASYKIWQNEFSAKRNYTQFTLLAQSEENVSHLFQK